MEFNEKKVKDIHRGLLNAKWTIEVILYILKAYFHTVQPICPTCQPFMYQVAVLSVKKKGHLSKHGCVTHKAIHISPPTGIRVAKRLYKGD